MDKIVKIVAVTSFALGTLILLAIHQTAKESLLEIGAKYLVIATIINVILLILLLLNMILKKIHVQKGLYALLINLSNFPIAFLYVLIIVSLTNKIRVEIDNSSNDIILNVRLSGCKEYNLGKISNGKKKAVWVDKYEKECLIILRYNNMDEYEGNQLFKAGSEGWKYKYKIE